MYSVEDLDFGMDVSLCVLSRQWIAPCAQKFERELILDGVLPWSSRQRSVWKRGLICWTDFRYEDVFSKRAVYHDTGY